MNIYLAHNWTARDYLRLDIVPKLQAAGHKVTSRWLTGDDHTSCGPVNEAQTDYQDVMRSDRLVLFTENYGDSPGRGKFVELGLALAFRIPIILVGLEENCVFYSLPGITRLKTVEDFIQWAHRS